ncbi:MAG TPA: GGDEF domain-containing protein [Tepidiformaceae bacterium]|nr:GGDEF domain-containing protein [Tepidiformaceae bacterium]
MLGKLKRQEPRTAPSPQPSDGLDPETGLLDAAGFQAVLERQLARDLRYGSTSALALFEIAVAERDATGPLPSPAPFVAGVLRAAVRGADVVARVSPVMFAVLLIEAKAEGAAQFTERVRTSIGSAPYARDASGNALYVRAWAGVAPWQPEFETVERYARAAERSLMATYRGYEAAQEWFRGEGLNRPFSV